MRNPAATWSTSASPVGVALRAVPELAKRAPQAASRAPVRAEPDVAACPHDPVSRAGLPWDDHLWDDLRWRVDRRQADRRDPQLPDGLHAGAARAPRPAESLAQAPHPRAAIRS